MNWRAPIRTIILVVLFCLARVSEAIFVFSSAQAGDLTVKTQLRTVRLLDRQLVTSQGANLRFVSDLIANKQILLSFTFTGCVQLCPPSDVIMDLVAQRLDNNGGQQVQLVTLTLDPLTDTPERLRRERADLMHPNRIFLSGDPNNVWTVLDGLSIRPGPSQDHEIQFLLIGNGGREVTAIAGLPDPEALLAALTKIQ